MQAVKALVGLHNSTGLCIKYKNLMIMDFGKQGEKSIYFRTTNANIGEQGTSENIFFLLILGNQGASQFISGEQENV